MEEPRQAPRWVPSPEELSSPVVLPATAATAPTDPAATAARGRDLTGTQLLLVGLLVGALLMAVVTTALGDASVAVEPRAATLVLYEAEEGVMGAPTFVRDGAEVGAGDRAEHDALWGEWTAMIPPYWTRRVSVFEIASDGDGGVMASVARLDEDGDRWVLSVDPVDAAHSPERYLETLVHELAHILTLGDGAVELRDPTGETLASLRAACAGPAVSSGCAVPGTVLHRFVETYWPAGMRDGSLAGDVQAVVDAQYLVARDDFVSPYAASGPSEDIAETFVALALDRSLPRGSVAEAKVELLRGDPELFSVADRIRATVRAR